MNCLILPALKRLDQEPLEEFEDVNDGAVGCAEGKEGRRGQIGDAGLVLGLSFTCGRLK
jgi:hypothetical protein